MREYAGPGASFQPLSRGVLQRKCACGGAGGMDQCDECRAHALQRKGTGSAPLAMPASVREAIGSPGRALDPFARALLEPRFSHDFSRVRVHTDARAGDSARAVGAAAYTVGRDIVFAPGQFAPASAEGQSLLAHELAHVIQQETGDPERLVTAPDSAEREAERASAQILSASAPTVDLSRTGVNLSMAPSKTGGTPAKPKVDPVIEQARAAAFQRVLLARQRTGGVGPPPPSDPQNPASQYPDTEAITKREEVRHYASRLFAWQDPNMDQIHGILENMLTALAPGMPVTRAAAGDKECQMRGGYVMDHKPPIVLCPAFFSSSAEEKVRTMIHESAHVAGIGKPEGEAYCILFTYNKSCGGFGSADSWAQFVNAVSDQPADKGEDASPGKKTQP